MTLKINFDELKTFSPENLKGLERVVGLYFICSEITSVPYPFMTSSLLYIGMSEKPSNSIATRLKSHYDGTSGNAGILNYRKVQELKFTYINFEALKSFWQQSIEDLESYFIQDFLNKYGVYPICNNKVGFPEFREGFHTKLEINWQHFDGDIINGK